MPKGVPNRPRVEHLIDIHVEEPTRMTPALGQVDRLLKQSLLETQSLQVVRHMLMRDTMDRAQQTGANKLLAAANIRTERRAEVNGNGNGHHAPLPFEEPEPKPAKKSARQRKGNYGQSTRQVEAMSKTNITGPRLNLFILERLIDANGEFVTGKRLLELLKETGKADHIIRLSGVFGLLSNEGLVKHNDLGYRITATGQKFAARLRSQLETDDACIPGSYLAPANFTLNGRGKASKRMGYKTMAHHMTRKQTH